MIESVIGHPRMDSLLTGYYNCSSLKEKVTMKPGYRDRSFARWRTYLHNCIGGGSSVHRIKLFIVFCLFLASFLLLSCASSFMGWSHNHKIPELSPRRPGYTVLINTWKRYDLLKRSVSHYAKCEGADAIRVVWSEPNPPSEALQSSVEELVTKASRKADRRGQRRCSFQFDVHVQDDLNNRFKPLDGLRTDAVLSIDDDLLIPCLSLQTAFDVWASAPNTMVGFVPRMHWAIPKRDSVRYHQYSYGGWWSVWWTGTYSMVLTKAAFLHQKYLEMYTNQIPASLRQYVKERRNCEDIAMSFLVANETGAPPIWVKTALYEIGSTGISSLQGHNEHRTDCINYFVSLFGSMPLVASHVKVADARHLWFW